MGRQILWNDDGLVADPAAQSPATWSLGPSQVVGLLGLAGIRFDQLRRFHAMARASHGGPAPARSARSAYNLIDLAELAVIVDLTGGRDRLVMGKRLAVGNLAAACVALNDRGFVYPLLEVRLTRSGRTVHAVIDGDLINQINGQLVLSGVLGASPSGPQFESIRNPALRQDVCAAVEKKLNALAQARSRSAGTAASSALSSPPKGNGAALAIVLQDIRSSRRSPEASLASLEDQIHENREAWD
jgi:hypothetical protein